VGAGRVGQPCQFFQMLIDVMTGRAALGRSTDENGALDWRGE